MNHGFLLFLLLFLLPPGSYGQPAVSDSSYAEAPSVKAEEKIRLLKGGHPTMNEFSIWGGYAFNSMKLWGKTPNTQLSQIGVGYNRKFLALNNAMLEYRLELDLFVHYSYPQFDPYYKRTSLSGIGISPLGFQLNFLKDSDAQPYLSTSGGFIVLEREFPDERGTRFNYTFAIGMGIEIGLTSNSSVLIGYRYFHLSNAEVGMINPGIDSNSLYLAFTFF